MAYTLAQIIADVKIPVAADTNQSLDDSFFTRRINDAIEDIVFTLELPEFEETDESLSLVTSQRSYSLSAIDPLVIQSIKDVTSDTALAPLTREQADQWTETETGEPSGWLRFGLNIEIYPLPASANNGDTLRIRYIKKPTELSYGTDVCPLPSYLNRAVREYAIAACLMDLEEPERASKHFAVYIGVMKTRRNIRGKEARYQHRTIAYGLFTGGR